MNKNITTSKVFQSLRNRKEKIVVLEGSSRSTKTYSIIQHLIGIALENEQSKNPQTLRIAILRARLTWLKNTVYQDFKTILSEQFGIWDESCMNKTEFFYTLGRTQFIFSGLDHDQGQKFHGAKYNYAWLNEAVELDWPSVNQILLRLSGGQMFIDYNPNMDSHHWIEKKIKGRDDTCVIHSTYKDNPFLGDDVVEEIERYEPTAENIANGTADEVLWKIYGLGIRASMHGLIYPEWQVIDSMPQSKSYLYGLDWGYSNDPCALVRCLIQNGTLYCQEMLYARGLTNIDNPKNPQQNSVEKELGRLKINSSDLILADSSEPKSVQDILNCGYNIKGIQKKADSVNAGIMTVRRYKIAITEDSTNLITEISRYKWQQNHAGDSLNKPVAGHDHCLDCIRYVSMYHDAEIQQSNYAYDSASPRFRLVDY